jgi:ribosomal protein S13
MIALGITLGASLSREAVEQLVAAEHELHLRIEAAARAAADAADVVFGSGEGAPRVSVLSRGLRPGLALSRHVAISDLVVFGQGHLDRGVGSELFSQCLLSDRAPVLGARQDAQSLSGPAAIAWDGSPQAGRAVKAALLDQSLVAGIGNIYGDEILHRARVHPKRPARNVSSSQLRRLHACIHEVLNEAIAAGGSTLDDAQYVDLMGEAGSFQERHRVYGRAGERCLSCGRGRVVSAVVGGRTTSWCGVCQR